MRNMERLQDVQDGAKDKPDLSAAVALSAEWMFWILGPRRPSPFGTLESSPPSIRYQGQGMKQYPKSAGLRRYDVYSGCPFIDPFLIMTDSRDEGGHSP